jgi:hypothetical protein
VIKQAQNGEITPVTFAYTPPAPAEPAPAQAAAPAVTASLNPGNLKDPWLQKAKMNYRARKGIARPISCFIRFSTVSASPVWCFSSESRTPESTRRASARKGLAGLDTATS